MEEIDELSFVENILKMRAHQPSGPVYKSLRKRHALLNLNKNELKGIYSLTESHAPTMRIKTTYRYDRMLHSGKNELSSMNKKHMEFNCPNSTDEEIIQMLKKVHEMPKEWTIVQLTTQYNLNENLQLDLKKLYTDPLHISVFSCGQGKLNPFCVSVNAPLDLNGDIIQLCSEMKSIIEENKTIFHTFIGNIPSEKITAKQKKSYSEHRNLLNERLKDVVKQLERKWLKEWRCLLIGKLIDENVEKQINAKIDKVLSTENNFEVTEKLRYIINKIIMASDYLSPMSIMQALQHCIPNNKDLQIKVNKEINNIVGRYKFKQMKRHPVILIIDEKLDCFCWEMIDTLVDHPVSRIPSLHFAYALYKEHEQTIVNGFKEISPLKGTYLTNPSLDLKKMEERLKHFFNFWLPEWEGLTGETPSSDKFSELLNGGDIFVYSGHGSGIQFLSGNKIQQMRVNSVVLLFGCSSLRMMSMGPLIEMTDVFHNYMIACSPCVVGMLWEVTDFDTDVFSTDLLSRWLPSKSKPHWSHIDKNKWQKGIIVPLQIMLKSAVHEEFEPELLRAINIARKAPSQYITRSALVARGLPVKLII